MKTFTLTILLSLILAAPGWADGRQLKAWCDGSDRMGQEPDLHQAASDTFLGGVCLGFIDATYRALNRRDYCGPPTATRDAVVKVARKFLNDHPERLGEDESKLVRQAFQEAYPCVDF